MRNRSHRERVVRRAVLAGVMVVGGVACAPRPPIISEPPIAPRLPMEAAPWEEQYGRAMAKPEAMLPPSTDTHEGEKFNGALDDHEERSFVSVVADVIAFPFRAFGWLVQTIF